MVMTVSMESVLSGDMRGVLSEQEESAKLEGLYVRMDTLVLMVGVPSHAQLRFLWVERAGMETSVLMGTVVLMDIVACAAVTLPHIGVETVLTLDVANLDMNVNQVVSMAVIDLCVMEDHLFYLQSK